MDMFKQAGGLKPGQGVGDISNTNQMVGMGNLANSVFGTKGGQGFDALMMLEKVQKKQMSEKEFGEKVKKMQESTPETDRLDKINTSLAGQTDLLTNIDTNLAESLGKEGVGVRNAAKKVENAATGAGVSGAQYLNKNGPGMLSKVGEAIVHPQDFVQGMLESGYDATKNKIKGWIGMGGNDIPSSQTPTSSEGAAGVSAKDMENAFTNALKKTPISTSVDANVTVKGGMSKMNESTYK
jgi:hypothetical protein